MTQDGQLSKKADLALSDLTSNGGILSPEQNQTFIRTLIDQPTLINRVRTVPMTTPEQKINKIGFGSRILFPARQAGGENNGANARFALPAERSKPTTSQITMSTKEVIAEVRIPYEVLEDNIERGSLENTILTLIAQRAALDLEELLIKGDSASGDAYLALMDGILKRITTNVVDAANGKLSAALFNTVMKTLETKYRRNVSQMGHFVSMNAEQDYRLAVASRGTNLGDQILQGTQPTPVFGVPLVGVALMPDANAVFTNPQNVIWGVQRNVRIEQDRDIRSREVIIVLTMRVATQIEEETACVKVINIG